MQSSFVPRVLTSAILRRLLAIALTLLGAALLPLPAHAQFLPTGAGPFDYNATSNWTGATINGVFSQMPSAAQVVTFDGNSTLTSGLTFSLSGTSPSLTLRGDGTERTVTLGGDVSVSGTTSAIVLGSTTAGNGLNFLLGADRTFSVASGNTLTVNNVVSGANALTKTGTGQLTLAGANTYTGTTTVNAGTLLLNASGTLASGSNVVVNSTTAATTAAVTLGAGFTQTIGTLTFSGAGGAASNNNVTLNTGSTLTLGGTVTYNGATSPLTSTISGGTVVLGGNRTFAVSDSTAQLADLNISSTITGSGNSLTKTGTGRLQLTGANTYDGGTILNGGVIFAGSSSALGTGPVIINNLLDDISTLGVNTGSGGNTTIGALTFGGGGVGAGTNSQNDLGVNTSTLTLGGTVTYDATNNPKGSTISSISTGTLALGVASGAARTFAVANSASTTTELTISAPVTGVGGLTKTGAGVLTLSGVNTYTGTTTVNAGTLTLGASGALATGNGIVINANAASTTALLSLGTGANLTVGALTFGGAGGTTTSTNNLTLSSTSTLTLGGTVTYDATGNPLGSLISGGTVALGGNRTFNIGNSGTVLSDFGISSIITGSGQSLIKTGAGRMLVNAANTYDGGTIINGGLFWVNGDNTLVATAPVTINDTEGAPAGLTVAASRVQTIGALTFGGAGATASSINNVTLNTGSALTLGGTVTYDATNNPLGTTISGSGSLVLGANRIFDIADSTGTTNEVTIVAPISGAGFSLTKTGAGTLRLSGANTYGGGTILNGGSILLNASNTLASSGAVTINNTSGATSTLTLGANFTQTVGALTFGGAGGTAASVNNVTIGTGGTLTLGGTVTFDATGNSTASTVSTISGGTLALGGNRTFAVADSTGTSNELAISSVISGAGQSITKTGAGRLYFLGANTYDGGTVLNGGQIFLGANNTLVSTGAVTVNNTVGATSNFILSTNVTQTIGALTFGGTGATTGSTNNVTLNTGATLTLGGTVTYIATGNPAAATIAGPGTLAIGAARTFDIGNSSSSVNEIIISAPVSGGSITKIGAGNLNLSGANTYTGGTIVSAGGLVVRNTTGSGVGTGALTIQNGANLRGSGFIGGFTTIQSGASLGTGGTGATPGNLTFTNGLTLNDGAVFNFTLGTTSDKFTLTGGTLTGASTLGSLTINLTAGTGFGAGVYTLFDFSTGGVTTSSFDVGDFAFGTTVSGYTYGLAMAGNMLQLTATASAIPEPSTYAAIFGALSLVGAALWRRRVRA